MKMESLDDEGGATLELRRDSLDVRRRGEPGWAPGNRLRIVGYWDFLALLHEPDRRVAQARRRDEPLGLGLRQQVVEATLLAPRDEEWPALPVLLEEPAGVDRLDTAGERPKRPCRLSPSRCRLSQSRSRPCRRRPRLPPRRVCHRGSARCVRPLRGAWCRLRSCVLLRWMNPDSKARPTSRVARRWTCTSIRAKSSSGASGSPFPTGGSRRRRMRRVRPPR